jgi:hypothetical protein
MSGFGHEPFGHFQFGHANWALTVLWDELPGDVKQQDLDAGGWYYKFVTSMVPSFSWLKNLIYGSEDHLIDARTARKDVLGFLARSFGIIPDLAEPEEYQRMKIEMVGRWRLIKGTEEAYKVLCAIHGFDVTVYEIWWDGSNYSKYGPSVANELIGVVP